LTVVDGTLREGTLFGVELGVDDGEGVFQTE
jgi:hypothetical protein